LRFYKYLEKYPSEAIADTLGVKPATVKRWRRKGEIPNKHKELVREVKTKRVASKARRAKTLRETDVGTIASLAEVSVATVRKWKRAGEIPLEHRMMFVDAYAESTVPLELHGPVFEDKETSHFFFTEMRWHPNTLLTDSSMVEMLRALSHQKVPRGASVQVRFVGTAILSESDELRNYELIQYVKKPGSQLATVKFYSQLFKRKSLVLNSAEKVLKEQLPKSMTVKELTFLVRERK